MDAKTKFTPKDLTVMTHMKREFVLYQVQDSELTTLASGYTSIHFTLAGLAFGGLVSSITTLKTAALSEHTEALFFSMFFVSLVSTVYFGWMARTDRKKAIDTVLRITNQSKPM